jgi:hypothetical protein
MLLSTEMESSVLANVLRKLIVNREPRDAEAGRRGVVGLLSSLLLWLRSYKCNALPVNLAV